MLDLFGAEDIWLGASVTGLYETPWWYFVSWVCDAHPCGESPNGTKALCPCRSLNLLGLRRPTEGKFRGDELRSFALEEFYEMTEC